MIELSHAVSIVIATYNRCADLAECLDSISCLKTKPHEVIVVDSNSTDDTKKLKDRFPTRFVSISERNRQRARNLGISMASGDIVAFLDDDVVVCKDWLGQIVGPYLDESTAGVGGRVVPYGTAEEFHLKTRENDIGKVLNSGLVIGNFDLPSENPTEVDSFIGCNMSFRRELLLKVGGFDENYMGTGYRDDTDLCMRIRKLGCRLLYHPKALVWHKFRGKHVNSDWAYWYVRNHEYFYLKNIFAQYKTSLPLFFYRMFLPPRDYIQKSGVKLKIEPALVPKVFKGLYDGYKTWRNFVQVK